MRADADRNRERVLSEARRTLAAGEALPPLNELARRTGVGVGTVYRQFPTSQSLLEAVVADRLRELIDIARTPGQTDDPAVNLAAFIRQAAAMALAEPGLAAVLVATSTSAQTAQIKAELGGCVSQLLARAQDRGAARAIKTGEDILRLLCGIQHAASASGSTDQAAGDRYVTVVLAGLGLPTAAAPQALTPRE